jgi:undecaprenyl-diphosphatase
VNFFTAVLFGAVEGLTEFLPVSSTGHLTILERLLGYQVDARDVTAFTAIIQTGAVLATLIFLRDEFRRIVFAIIRGMFRPGWRADPDWRFGWAVVLGSVPIGIVGLLFQDQIETTFRSLWFVAVALIAWSLPMLYADRTGTQKLGESDITWRDTLIIGLAQCLALVPGVSRSGATMTAGLLRGFDRVAVTRLSFMLSVPALTAAGILQAYTAADDISAGVGWPATIVATVVSFVVAYFSVAWLLRFVARHTFILFIGYRIVLGALLLVLLASGVVSAT